MVAGCRLAAATSPWVSLGRSSVFEQLSKVFGPASAAYLFISAAHIFVVGYSYANTYYDRFGLQLNEIDIGYLETVEFSANLFRHPLYLSMFMFIGAAFTAAYTYIYSISLRPRASGAGVNDDAGIGDDKEGHPQELDLRLTPKERLFVLASTSVLLGSITISVFIGDLLGNQYATAVIMGDAGRTTDCELLRGNKFSNEFRVKFKIATKEERVIKIKETEKMIYLFVVPKPNKSEESNHDYPGESYVFHKSDFSHCRVAGARSQPDR